MDGDKHTKADFELAVAVVLKHEGGFVDDKTDPGGATNYGVSLRFLKAAGDLDGDGYLDGDFDHDGDVDYQDIRNATPEQAKSIYHLHWWLKYAYGDFGQKVATKLLDCSVNMGAKQAHVLLQRAANKLGARLDVDGQLGPSTRRLVNLLNPDAVLAQFRLEMRAFYEALIRRKPQFEKYRNGWLRRAAA